MGRKKIPIERIPDNRNRQITFMKRKLGLFKKAYQLSVLCDCQISVIIMPKNNKLFQYSSSDMNAILQKYVSHPHPDEALTNEDMAKKIQTVALGSDDDVETPVQDMSYDGVQTMFNQQVILDQQYKPQIDPRILHQTMYQRTLVDPTKIHSQDLRMQYHNPILPQKMPVAIPSHLDDASPRSVQSATDFSSISSPPPKEDAQKSERLKVIESGNLSLTLPMASKIPVNAKVGRVPSVNKSLKIVVPNSKGIPVTTTVPRTLAGDKVGQGMVMASSHLHTPNINMQTPREMVFTSDGMDFFSSATYTPFGLGMNNFSAVPEDREGNALGNLIPLSHAATLSRVDLQKQIKTDPDPTPIGTATPSELAYQSPDEDNSPNINYNQEPESSTNNSELVQIPEITLNGLNHKDSSVQPITHSLLGQVDLSEALDEAERETRISPVSRVPHLISTLSPGQNTDTMMSLTTSDTLSSINHTPVRVRRKCPAPGINESTRTALQSKLNGHIPLNGSHSLLPASQIQPGNPTLSFMNAPHLQMNYYQHIPQITPGLGAAFYSPSEYLTKPNEFPISSIRLINPSLLHSATTHSDHQDVANMPSPPSSSEGYADTDLSNKRPIEQASLEDLSVESLPRKKAHTSSDQLI